MSLSADWLYFLTPLGAFSVNVVAQIASYRILFSKSGAILKSVFAGYLAGLIFLACVYLLSEMQISAGERMVLALSNFIFFSCLWYCFFHYVNIGQASLRIRMMIELQNHPNGLAKETLLAKYNNRLIVATRLHRLVSSGQVIRQGDYYTLGKPGFTLIMGFFRILSKIVWGARSPIDEHTK
jgi:hypothetical protein